MLQKATRVDDCLVMKNVRFDGYASTKLAGVTMGSHRASYILNNNDCKPLPATDEAGNNLVVRHTCPKQRGCIEPSHLILGTSSQNSYEDKIASGTLSRGEKHYGSKITQTLAQEIKSSRRPRGHHEYMTLKNRAEKFKVKSSTISAIDANTSWAHLPDRFGVVKSNAERRRKLTKRRRHVKSEQWSLPDFSDAAKYIKARVLESEKDKGGEFPDGPCWDWQQCKDLKGYGKSAFKGRPLQAHVLSLASEYKRFPKQGEVVRHLCANPKCCNYEHLRLGTRRENAVDIQLNGSSKAFKLNPEKVRMIRVSNVSSVELAKTFGVHPDSISDARSGKTWSSVK